MLARSLWAPRPADHLTVRPNSPARALTAARSIARAHRGTCSACQASAGTFADLCASPPRSGPPLGGRSSARSHCGSYPRVRSAPSAGTGRIVRPLKEAPCAIHETVMNEHPRPPFPAQQQPMPGTTEAMNPRLQHLVRRELRARQKRA